MTQLPAGGAGDMALTASLSTAQVEASLARLETAMVQSAARLNGTMDRVGRSFYGMNRLGPAIVAGVAGGYAMARKSLLDYADKNDEVKSKVETLGAVWGRVWDNIGRQTADSGVLEYLTEVGRKIDEFQTGLETKTAFELKKDALKSAAWGSAAALALGPLGVPVMLAANAKASQELGTGIGASMGDGDPAVMRRAQEEASREARVQAILHTQVKRGQAKNARASGDVHNAQLLELEIAREEAEREAAKVLHFASAERQRAFVEELVSETAEAHRRENMRRRADARKIVMDREAADRKVLEDNDLAVRDRNAMWERNRVRSEADARFLEREAEIAAMRADGREREAEAAALTLRYDKERKALELDDGLSAFDKGPILNRINQAEAIERALLGRNADRIVGARSLGGGLAGSNIAGMVFGSGPKTNDAQRDMLNEQRKATKVLERIEQKIGGGATFA